MKTIIKILILIALVLNTSAYSFAQKKVSATGFFEYLNNTWIPGSTYNDIGLEGWQSQSTIYNRINLWYNPNDELEFHAGIRNNFTFGPLINNYNKLFNYTDFVINDDGYLDLTWKIASGNSSVLYTNIDRLSMKWTMDKFELTAGRQRINWGTNLVWNPNDIFNAFNYFDFNYIERPGSDALLLEYYTGDFSSVQIAGKLSYRYELIDSLTTEKKLGLTAAAMYKFNKWGYDIQFFGGVMQTDITAGLGWSGSIGGAGFTGEASYFRDMDEFIDTTGIIIASISGNYVFGNQIMINLSGLYNSNGSTGKAYENNNNILGSFSNIFASSLNVKNLTPSKLDLFGQISYPATPLVNVSLSAMLNPWDMSSYIGPSATFSLTDNINLMLVGQMFFGEKLTEFGDYGQMFFLDLKWNF